MRARPLGSFVKRIAPIAVVAIASVAAWLLPSAFGMSSSFDFFVIALWLIVAVALTVDMHRRDRKRKILMRTFYVDFENRRAFSPSTGMIAYEKGCDLIDAMIAALAADSVEAHMELPPDFNPALAVETAVFECAMDERIRRSKSAVAPDDVTVLRWEGKLVDLETGDERKLSSAFDMEDVFCTESYGCPQPCLANAQ